MKAIDRDDGERIKLKLKEIRPYAGNAKVHTEKQVATIRELILNLGYRNKIEVDENNIVLVGHGRLRAFYQIDPTGEKEITVVKYQDMSEHEKKAYRIAENKSTALTGFDDDILKGEFNALEDSDCFNFTGFSKTEITSIWEKPEAKLLDPEEDDVNEVDQLGHIIIECPKCKFKIKRKK